MTITHFYTHSLGVKLRNTRWSWGAIDPMTNSVFLSVWDCHIECVSDGERIRVRHERLRKTPHGYNERCRHLNLIRQGATGFGIVCTPKDTEAESWEIKSFDETMLLRLGRLVEKNDKTYAYIDARVSVEELPQRGGYNTLIEDVRTIIRKVPESTIKDTLVSARVGQGLFRAQVLELWDNRCSVTRSTIGAAIRASHIKPWRYSTDEERLDPNNGLPLVGSLDALFDAGLISFKSSGILIVSSVLSESERQIFGLNARSLTKKPTQRTALYLEYHRDCVFKK